MPCGVPPALAASLVVVSLSCADRAPSQPPLAPPRAVTSTPDAGLDALPAPAPDAHAHQIQFEPAPLVAIQGPSPHVEIQFPIAEQSIRIDKAAKYKVRLKVENWPVGDGGRGVELVLDDFRPKRVAALDPPVELGQLVPEDAELRPGEHVLVAMAVRENGEIVRPPRPSSLAPFALVHFWIGERGAARISPSAPRLVYSQPRGTVNGEAAAERILLDFLPIGVEIGKGKTTVVVRVRGANASGTTILDVWQPTYLVDVPSGDYQVELELVGSSGQPLTEPFARAHRTITVNRDAPVEPRDGGA